MANAREGWGFPAQSRKIHYFDGETSLCGGWLYGGPLEADDGKERQSDCVPCRKALAKRGQGTEMEARDA